MGEGKKGRSMTANSEQLFARSQQVIPGGVHSPVRSFKGLHTHPRFIARAQGARLWDVEGRDYIDFCMSFGPLILGHQNSEVNRALAKALEQGQGGPYGACAPEGLELAEFLVERIAFIDQIRFVNSGTEAVMTAIRLARGVTGRDKIIKFNGCYHGHGDNMLIRAGSGLATAPTASSLGVPLGVSQDTLVVELGDREALERVFERYGAEVAAVIIEPLPANYGLLVQDNSFLEYLRAITTRHQALLIFDEVISGFRVGFGGMAEHTAITPDLVTYGKIIGGGLPVGGVAGKREIMEHLAPVGEVYQAGTLSAHPLAMAGGLATLRQLTPEVYRTMGEQTKKIAALLQQWLQQQGDLPQGRVVVHSSLFWLARGHQPGSRAKAVREGMEDYFHSIFQRMLERGIYLAPSAYEVGFVSLAHDHRVLEQLRQRLWG